MPDDELTPAPSAEAPSVPSVVAALLALPQGKRRELLEQTSDVYDRNLHAWRLLADALDGTGGFATGGYLWRFPRERDAKWGERCEQARYHNYVAPLVDLYTRQLFGQGVRRTTTDEELEAWWDDVDGRGTTMTTFLQQQLPVALATGQVGILMDRPPQLPAGPSQAEERQAGQAPYLVAYEAPAILDYRDARQELVAVKLRDLTPPLSLLEEPADDDDVQTVVWTLDGWGRFDATGALLQAGIPPRTPLGLVPFVWIVPTRRRGAIGIGRPLLHPSLVKALFNRASEEDDVLRNQAFSLFTVELPPSATESDLAAAESRLGDVGTTSALVVAGSANYRTPDQSVSASLRENQAYLVQELYRAAHIRFQRDSLAAESGEALRLQHDELNQALVGLAQELTRVELALAYFWCAWQTRTPAEAEARFEAAQVSISYPREFFLRELEVELKAWAEAIRFGLGETFTKRTKKRIVQRMDPDLDVETKQQVDDEIDAGAAGPGTGAPGPVTAESLRATAAARLQRFAAEPTLIRPTGQGEGDA